MKAWQLRNSINEAACGGGMKERLDRARAKSNGRNSKGAHPEKWPCGAAGRVTLPNFKPTSGCPQRASCEVSGWQGRLEMAWHYLWPLVNPQPVERAYSALVPFRCALGLGLQHRAHLDALQEDSMSTLKANGVRTKHDPGLLDFLRRSASSQANKRIADTLFRGSGK